MVRIELFILAVSPLVLFFLSGLSWGWFNRRIKIEKPRFDERKYEWWGSKGGLRALLIADESTQKSSAVVRVMVGSLEDPVEFPGLAHLLEHAVFLGRPRFRELCLRGSGYSNAYTDLDRTVYYFEISNDFFEETLLLFGEMLSHPELKDDLVRPEISAVHSEHQKNLNVDPWRTFQLERNLGNPNSPMPRFATGSKETLDRPGLESALSLFFKTHYLAANIYLTLLGPSAPVLRKLASEFANKFSSTVQPQIIQDSSPLYSPEELGVFVVSQSISAIPTLKVSFFLSLPNCGPLLFAAKTVVQFLGHEGSGSLSAEIQRQNLALRIDLSLEFLTKDFAKISAFFSLTPNGVTNHRHLLALLSQTIHRAKKSVLKQFFYELKTISSIYFQFQPTFQPLNLTLSSNENQSVFRDEKVLSGPFDYGQFNSKTMIQVIEELDFKNSIVILSGPEAPLNFTTEPIYSTKFNSTKFTAEELELYRKVPLSPHITAPHMNPFIPNITSVEQRVNFHPQKNDPSCHSDSNLVNIIPENKRKHGKMFYCPNVSFKQPQIHASFIIYIDRDRLITPLQRLYLSVWVHLINKSVKNLVYQASLAMINTSIRDTITGFEIEVNGLAPKLPLFVKSLSNEIKRTLQSCPSKSEYDLQVLSVASELDEKMHSMLFRFAMKEIEPALIDSEHPLESFIQVLSNLSYTEYCEYHLNFYKENYIESLVSGKISKKEAKTMFSAVKGALQQTALDPIRAWQRKLALPKALTLLILKNPVQDSSNNFALSTFFAGTSVEDRAFVRIVKTYLSVDFFEELRTIQQIGYVVFAHATSLIGHYAVRFGIQSEDFTPEQCLVKVLKYIEKKKTELDEMSLERFKEIKDGAEVELKVPFLNLEEMHVHFLDRIHKHSFHFGSKKEVIDLIDSFQFEKFKQKFAETFSVESPRLDIQFVSAKQYQKNLIEAKEAKLGERKIFTDARELKNHIKHLPDLWALD